MSLPNTLPALVDGAPGVRLIVVEHAVGRGGRITADGLARHLERTGDVQVLPAERAVGLVELLAIGRLLVGLGTPEVALGRQGRVVAHDVAAVGQQAHLPVRVPGRGELALGARRHGQEVLLLVLVPVHQVARRGCLAPGHQRHAAVGGRRRGRRRRRRRRARGHQHAAEADGGQHRQNPPDSHCSPTSRSSRTQPVVIVEDGPVPRPVPRRRWPREGHGRATTAPVTFGP